MALCPPVYPRKKTSQPDTRHRIYPYALGGIAVSRGPHRCGNEYLLPLDEQGLRLSCDHYGLDLPASVSLATVQESRPSVLFSVVLKRSEA
jgi:hypothetical protein